MITLVPVARVTYGLKLKKRLGNHHSLSRHKKNYQSVKSARLNDSNTSVAGQKRPPFLK